MESLWLSHWDLTECLESLSFSFHNSSRELRHNYYPTVSGSSLWHQGSGHGTVLVVVGATSPLETDAKASSSSATAYTCRLLITRAQC